MKQHSIAVLPGDGIGPEVVAEAVKILQAVQQKLGGFELKLSEYSVGAGEYLKSENPLPEETFEAIKRQDAILLGAMGLPDVRWPNGTEMAPQVDLRERLDLYGGLRPIRLLHADHTPLKGYGPGEIDFLLVRESTEGLFWARKGGGTASAEECVDHMRISRRGSLRLFRMAFEQARKRRNKVTLVDKANILPSMAFFRAIFDETADEFPDVETERVYVDAMSLFLVRRPETFDVMVTENMFGDILSDLAAGLIGGMGMAPSADVGDEYAVFQPSHGTAPDIAGRGWANPVATILSAAMMLDWLGEPAAANEISSAVERAMLRPEARTRDLGGECGCEQMGELILAEINGS